MSHAQLIFRTVINYIRAFFGPWEPYRSRSPPCWKTLIFSSKTSTASHGPHLYGVFSSTASRLLDTARLNCMKRADMVSFCAYLLWDYRPRQNLDFFTQIHTGFSKRLQRKGQTPSKICECVGKLSHPANMRYWTNSGLLLVHRLRRWANINSTLIPCLVFAGHVNV